MRRALVAVLLAACGAPAAPTGAAAPTGTAQLTLATLAADASDRALVDGESVELVEGAQGGFHVWMSYQVRDLSPMRVTVLRTAHRIADGKLVLRATGELDIGAPDGSGLWRSAAPVPMFLCPSPIGLSVIDQEIGFEVTFTDGAGATVAHGAVDLVPRCPAASAAFCQKICTG